MMQMLPFPLTPQARRRVLRRVLVSCMLVALVVTARWTRSSQPIAKRDPAAAPVAAYDEPLPFVAPARVERVHTADVFTPSPGEVVVGDASVAQRDDVGRPPITEEQRALLEHHAHVIAAAHARGTAHGGESPSPNTHTTPTKESAARPSAEQPGAEQTDDPTSLADTDSHGAPSERPAAQRWSTQQDDPVWTRSVSNYVEQSLLDLESDGELLETKCRDTLCRVQLRFASVHDAREFAEAASRPTDKQYTKLALDEDQRLTLEVFVSRSK